LSGLHRRIEVLSIVVLIDRPQGSSPGSTAEIRPVNEMRMRARWKLGRALKAVKRAKHPGKGKLALASLTSLLKKIGLTRPTALAAVCDLMDFPVGLLLDQGIDALGLKTQLAQARRDLLHRAVAVLHLRGVLSAEEKLLPGWWVAQLDMVWARSIVFGSAGHGFPRQPRWSFVRASMQNRCAR
jgi:hypothetical protein